MNRLSLRCQSSKSTELTKNLLFFSPFSVLSFENLSNSGSSLNASIPCTSLCNFRPLWCLQERLYYPLRVCLSCPRAELRSCRHITLNGPHNQFYLSFLTKPSGKLRRLTPSFGCTLAVRPKKYFF